MYKIFADLARPANNHMSSGGAARGESMQYRDALVQQRVRCIAEKFQERTANEVEPLSRERIREIIQGIVAELENGGQRDEVAGPQAPQVSRA